MKISMIEPVGGHGGMNYYDVNLCRELERSGAEVALYTCDETIEHKEKFEIRKTFKKIYGDDPGWIRGIRFIKGLFSSLFQSIRNRSDIVHYHFFKYTVLELLCVMAGKIIKRKVMITAHDIESFSNEGNKFLINLICSLADQMIVHNKSSKDALLSKVKLREDKVEIIPHGHYINNINYKITRDDAQKKLGIPARDSFVILFFGQIKKVKGLDLLIKALPEVINYNKRVKIIIAGKVWKDTFDQYLEQIRKYQLEEHFLLHIHYIPDQIVDYYFASSDLVVLPYRKIYQSGVLLNAMSHKKVVLTSNLPGMRDIIQDGDNGFIFKNGDSKDLAEKIINIQKYKEKITKVEDKAFQYVKQHHNWHVIAETTIRVYRKTLNSRSDKRRT